MHSCRQMAAVGLGGGVAVKALKAGQESYWLDQIARNRDEHFCGRGESPGRFIGNATTAAGLDGTASPEQVRAMFQGLDPATGQQRWPGPRRSGRRPVGAGRLPAGRCQAGQG
jgi:hypothetical protein